MKFSILTSLPKTSNDNLIQDMEHDLGGKKI